jgi:hypothetical protein
VCHYIVLECLNKNNPLDKLSISDVIVEMEEIMMHSINAINDRITRILEFLLDETLGRFVCVISFLIYIADCFFWAAWHQVHGSIPFTTNIHLIWWHWSLPFAVSRIWDLLIMPVLVFLIGWICTSKILGTDDDSYAGTIIIGCSTLSVLAGLILGVAYIPVTLVLLVVLLISAVIIFLCWSLLAEIWHWWREHCEADTEKNT